MGKARTRSSRKHRSKSSGVPPTTAAATPNNASDSNHFYESFPIMRNTSHSRSRSRSRSKSPERENAQVNPNSTSATRLPPSALKSKHTLEDPGNPLGNAVDFCVNNINALHAKSMELSFPNSLDMGFVLKPCEGKSFEQLIEDIFLCNNLSPKLKPNEEAIAKGESGTVSADPGKVDDSNGNPATLEDSFVRSSSKRGKHGWKKTMMIVPGKKLLRSMSLKRKKSNPNYHTHSNTTTNQPIDDEDEVWKGIVDEKGEELDDIRTMTSGDSDEDSLFTNLELDDTWTTGASGTSGGPGTFDEASYEDAALFSESPSAKANRSPQRKEFGDEGPNTEDTSCHLFFSPSSLCALPSTPKNDAAEGILEKGDLVIPRTFENDDQNNPALGSSIVKRVSSADKNKYLHDEEESKAEKVEFEMILEDSRFRHRWGNITPWKKLESIFASTSSSPSNRRRRRHSRSSSMESNNSILKTICEKNAPLCDKGLSKEIQKSSAPASQEEFAELELVLDDVSVSRNVIEPRSNPPAAIMISQRSARILRKRRLQSALRGFSSRSQSKRSSSLITKNRRSSWKKMLVISVPKGQRTRTNRFTGAKSTGKVGGADFSKDTTKRSGDNKSVGSSVKARADSDPLEYSESDEETTTAISNQSETNSLAMKDKSSTSVMGLHEWSWGVFNMDLKEGEENIHEESNNESTLSIPLFGALILNEDDDHQDDGDSTTNYTPQTESRSGDDDDTYGTSHDGWIMNEDQLVSFSEEEDSRKTGDSSGYTNGSDTSFDANDDDQNTLIDRQFEEVIVRSSGPDKSTTKSNSSRDNENVEKSTKQREGFHPLKSIRRSFHKRNKSKGSIDISSQVSVNAESGHDEASNAGDGSISPMIETVLLTKKGKRPFSSKKAAASSHPLSEDRDDSCSTTSIRGKSDDHPASGNATGSSRRGSLANGSAVFSKAKNFWMQQRSSRSKSPKHKQKGRSGASPSRIVTRSNSRRRWNVGKNPETDPTSKNIITVVTKPSTVATASTATIKSPHKQQTHEPRYRASLLDEEEEYDESTESASSNSRSWVRDDEDTQSDGFQYGIYDYFHTDPEVIRE